MSKQNNLGADLTKQILGENRGFNTSTGMGSTCQQASTRHRSTWFAHGSHLWFDFTVAKFTDHKSTRNSLWEGLTTVSWPLFPEQLRPPA